MMRGKHEFSADNKSMSKLESRQMVSFNLYSDQVCALSDMANETGEARTTIFRRILKWYIHREVARKEMLVRREKRLRALILQCQEHEIEVDVKTLLADPYSKVPSTPPEEYEPFTDEENERDRLEGLKKLRDCS